MSTLAIPPHLAHLSPAQIIAQAQRLLKVETVLRRKIETVEEDRRKDAVARNMTDAEWARKSFAAFVRQAWPYVPSVDPLVWGWHIDAIALHLECVARGEIRNLLINVGPGHAKPVWEEELVVERQRGRVRLADISVGDEVLTHLGRFRRVLAVHEQGELPLIAVTTHCGRSVKTTADHPYLTTRGWIEAGRLLSGDVLASVHASEIFGQKSVSPEEARLLGYIVGDGHVKYQTASFTNQDPETLADFELCATVMGFRTRRKQLPPSVRNKMPKASLIVLLPSLPDGKKKWHESTRGPHPVWSWLEKHGLRGSCSYSKRVPPAIQCATPELIAEFVGAYWSCDGTVETRGGDRTDCRVAACTVSEGLARDVQHLLLRLGLQSRVRRQESQIKTRRQGDLYISWTINITAADQAAKFGKLIPMRHSTKRVSIARYERIEFDRTLLEDPLIATNTAGVGRCRCLTVEDDASFTAGDLVVHNSVLMVVLWPAWVWTWWPKCQFLFGSYAVDIAIRDSVRCRAVIDSEWYQQSFARPGGWRLREDQNAKQYFVNTLGGERFSTGIGGTGRRAHIIGVDDPLQREKARSKVARDEANLWIGETLSQRFVNAQQGRIAMIQQRLHEEDSSGYVLAGGGWEHLMLPSEFDRARRCVTYHMLDGHRSELWRDPRQHDGDLLFPDLFPRDVLEGFKAPNRLGIDGYASQHQQLPTPATGNMFQRDWWRFHKPDGIRGAETAPRPRGCYEGAAVAVPDTFDQILISVDANFKAAETADPVSIGVIGVKGADVYVLERQSGPFGFKRAKSVLYDVWCRWEARFVRKVLIELAANGRAILEVLESDIPGIMGSVPSGSKEARAWAIQPQVQAGQVHLPDGAPWLDEWISQFGAFPRGKHDDDVDMLSQALIDLRGSRYLPPPDLDISLRPRTEAGGADPDWDDDR